MLRINFYILGIIILLLFSVMILSVGAVNISFSDVCKSFTGGEVRETYKYIVIHSRLPMVLTAILAGSGLSVAGLLMQTTFRNPLAGPSLLGVSSGASLGVALMTMAFPALMVNVGMTLPITGAIIGAAIIILLLTMFSGILRSGLSLLIIGIMLSYLCSAIVSLLNFFAPATDVKQFVVWGMGSFSSVQLTALPIMGVILIILLVMGYIFSKPLNALLLGERYMSSMGYNVKKYRTSILTVAGLLTAIVTAYCGPIGFIGLIVPHLARMVTKTSSHFSLMPAVILMGADVALICGFITVIPSGWGVLPINAVTPLIGVPVILYLLINARRLSF